MPNKNEQSGGRGIDRPSGVERTKFFRVGEVALAEALKGKTIGLWGTDVRVVVSGKPGDGKSGDKADVKPFTVADNQKKGKGYEEMLGMQPGDIYGLPYPFRHTTLSLPITLDSAELAKGNEVSGACVQVVNATLKSGSVEHAAEKRRGQFVQSGEALSQQELATALGLVVTGPDGKQLKVVGKIGFREDAPAGEEDVIWIYDVHPLDTSTTATPKSGEKPGEKGKAGSRRKAGEPSAEEVAKAMEQLGDVFEEE